MKKINFELLKNNESIIKENNINCIITDKITFVIKDDKYVYHDDILEKITPNEKIILEFNNNMCKVYIKEYNDYLPINLDVIENKKEDNIITIKYKIESEENILNTIKIEYI